MDKNSKFNNGYINENILLSCNGIITDYNHNTIIINDIIFRCSNDQIIENINRININNKIDILYYKYNNENKIHKII